MQVPCLEMKISKSVEDTLKVEQIWPLLKDTFMIPKAEFVFKHLMSNLLVEDSHFWMQSCNTITLFIYNNIDFLAGCQLLHYLEPLLIIVVLQIRCSSQLERSYRKSFHNSNCLVFVVFGNWKSPFSLSSSIQILHPLKYHKILPLNCQNKTWLRLVYL